jgi:hypothetical protein
MSENNLVPVPGSTVRAVSRIGGGKARALFATVLTVAPTQDQAPPDLSIVFMDDPSLAALGKVDWHQQFNRHAGVHHASHPDVKNGLVSLCWTDTLPPAEEVIDVLDLDVDLIFPPVNVQTSSVEMPVRTPELPAAPVEPVEPPVTEEYRGYEIVHENAGFPVKEHGTLIAIAESVDKAKEYIDLVIDGPPAPSSQPRGPEPEPVAPPPPPPVPTHEPTKPTTDTEQPTTPAGEQHQA